MDLPNQSARNWAMFAHLSAFSGHFIPFGHVFGPLIIWCIKKDELPFVNDQGKEALNFQITMTLALIVAAISLLARGGIRPASRRLAVRRHRDDYRRGQGQRGRGLPLSAHASVHQLSPAMPELAEVEFYRKQWDPGLRQKILRVELHAGDRIFRGTDVKRLVKTVTGSTYRDSEARAKLMCFRFSGGSWLGIHLGMSGGLRVESPRFAPGKHDHLVLVQKKRALVFSDPRKFGRVHFYQGDGAPDWWTKLPPAVTSPEFTVELVSAFFKRRARLAVKAALLVQTAFPGVGNWMGDEILWQARVDPRTLCGRLSRKAGARALGQGARSQPHIAGDDRRGLFRSTGRLAHSPALEQGRRLPAPRRAVANGDDRWADHALVREVPT